MRKTNAEQREEALNDLTLAVEYIMCAMRDISTGRDGTGEVLTWAKSKLKDAEEVIT